MSGDAGVPPRMRPFHPPVFTKWSRTAPTPIDEPAGPITEQPEPPVEQFAVSEDVPLVGDWFAPDTDIGEFPIDPFEPEPAPHGLDTYSPLQGYEAEGQADPRQGTGADPLDRSIYAEFETDPFQPPALFLGIEADAAHDPFVFIGYDEDSPIVSSEANTEIFEGDPMLGLAPMDEALAVVSPPMPDQAVEPIGPVSGPTNPTTDRSDPAAELAERLERVALRLRQNGMDGLGASWAGDRFDAALAGLLAGYLAARGG